MSSDVGGVEEGSADSYLVVAKRVGIGDAGQGFEVFDGFVERDTGSQWTRECAGMVTALKTTWLESASHFEVVLG